MNSESPEGPHERTVGRWYSVTRDGLACLCLDEANAREMAAQCDRDYPKHAPHKAVQLVDAAELDRLRAENEALRAALAEVERRLREDTAPIFRFIQAHGDSSTKRAWRTSIYASAIHAQLALTPNY